MTDTQSQVSAIIADPPAPGRSGFAEALKSATSRLHVQAERSGVIADVLRGRASRFAYALLLRNLLPAYEEMERGLELHRRSPGVRLVARPEVYRAGALAFDLAALHGSAWADHLPLLPAGDRYAQRLRMAAEGNGARLVAHAYARYLGDLSGGQILKRLLAGSLGLGPRALAFYDFPAIASLDRFKSEYRAAIDHAGDELQDRQSVLDEAALAFQLNIEVAEAVRDAAHGLGTGGGG